MAREKREKTAFEKEHLLYFSGKDYTNNVNGKEVGKGAPIDEWKAYIDEKSKSLGSADQRKLKSIARQCLTLEKMEDYILKHDNTDEAKSDFYMNMWGYKYEKDADGKYKTVGNTGRKEDRIPAKDEKGNKILIKSVMCASEHFISKYAEYLKGDSTSPDKFERVNSWGTFNADAITALIEKKLEAKKASNK